MEFDVGGGAAFEDCHVGWVGSGEDNGDGQPKLQELRKVEDRGKQHLDLGAGRKRDTLPGNVGGGERVSA